MKMKKIILSSLTSLMLCLSLIVGGTFALFSSESKVNVTISAGDVDVVATVEDLDVYSPACISEDGVIIDETNAADVNELKFVNGGAATLTDGTTLTLSSMTPGDKVTFNIVVKNNSNVAVIYQTMLTLVNDTGLFEALEITVNGEQLTQKGMLTAWSDLPVGSAAIVIPVEVLLPVSATASYRNKTAQLSFNVKALQGNAIPEDVPTVWGVPVSGINIDLADYDTDVTIPADGNTYILNWDSGDTSVTNYLSTNPFTSRGYTSPNPGTYFTHSIIVTSGAKVVLNGVNVRTASGVDALTVSVVSYKATYIYVADNTQNWLTGRSGIGFTNSDGTPRWGYEMELSGDGHLMLTATTGGCPAFGTDIMNDGAPKLAIKVGFLLALPHNNAAGIGGGNSWRAPKEIRIIGGTVQTHSGGNAAALGGGTNLNDNNIALISIENEADVSLFNPYWASTWYGMGGGNYSGVATKAVIACTAKVTCSGTMFKNITTIENGVHTYANGVCTACGAAEETE